MQNRVPEHFRNTLIEGLVRISIASSQEQRKSSASLTAPYLSLSAHSSSG